MFQRSDMTGGGGATAQLSLRDALVCEPAPAPSFASGLRARLAEADLVVDLGLRIGSREWFRGLATCTALCFGAISLAPDMTPVAGASPAPMADAQWDRARSLAFAPLAYGADTGRRMAPTDAVVPLAESPERPSVDLVATLGRGDGFARVLERSGVAAEEAARVAEMVAAHVALADIEPGTRMDLRLGRRADTRVARPLDMLAFRARFDLKLEIRRGETGRLAVHRIPIAVDNRPLRIQGYVGRGLYHAARAAGVPPRTVAAYLKALATQIDVGRITGDDRFDIIVEHSRAETGETRIGELLYAGLDRSVSKDLQLIQWQQGGRTQWFEASGVGQQRGELQKPVPGPVSSGFGIRRHPILGYARMHRGVDFRASYGTPVRAATDGRVTYAGWNGGYGRHVKIKHDGGLATSYSHLSRFAVASGQHVRQGEVIGYVGSTGLSTGAHLHYEMYRNGRAVDPRSVSYITRALLSGEELARFRAKLAGLLAIPAGAREAPESRLAGKRGDAPDA